MEFSKIEDAIEDIRQGKMILVVDDENRENEGDLVIAADKITPEAINFMAVHARGLICLPMDSARLDKLQLGQMVANNTDNHETAFTVSIDAFDTETGISAYERARTVEVAIHPDTKPADLRRPGHIFPLRAVEGGVLRRTGHTEAAVDLAVMAGFSPAGVICEVMKDDGHMARVPELMEFAEKHQMKLITIKDLIAYRKRTENFITKAAETNFPSKYGSFRLIAYENSLDKKCHVAIVKGDVRGKENVLVRVHSECLTGDAFGSLRCDCGDQLALAFYASGVEIKRYPIRELVADTSRLRRTVSHFFWLAEQRFDDAAGEFHLKTVDGRQFRFSIRTGAMLSVIDQAR